MNENLKQAIVDEFGSRVDALGFAPVERFAEAPAGRGPDRVCRQAQSVVVMGVRVPRGMLRSPDFGLYAMHRTYHSVYPLLDELTLRLANFIEMKTGGLAVPVPSFAPLKYEGPEPWGILSLKHAAVRAGLGAFGRGGLVINPEHGSLLRLGAVVTDQALPGDPVQDEDPCPEGCRACHQACPSKAFDDDGQFHKLTCLKDTIKHAIYPLAIKSADDLKHLERINNTAGLNYWLTCNNCLKACPANARRAA